MAFPRRWWCAAAVAAAISAAGWGTLLARAAGDPVANTKALLSTTGPAQIDARQRLIGDAPPLSDTMARDDYANKLDKAAKDVGYTKLDATTQLNLAIAVASMQTLSTDKMLEEMLTTGTNPGVRYWGAKGLSGIKAYTQSVGGRTLSDAIDAMSKQLAAEKSSVVKEQIIRSLSDYNEGAPIVAWLGTLAKEMQAKTPDKETLELATVALNAITPMTRGNTLGKPQDVAKSIAWVANFVSQQEVAYGELQKKDGRDLPEGYHNDVLAVVTSAVKALNGLAGKTAFTFTVSATQTPEEVELLLNGITGSSGGPGKVQDVFPGVPVPPDVKK